MRRRIHACHMRRRIRKKVRQYIRKVRNIIKTRRQPLYSLGRVHVWALTCVWPCGCLLAYIASRWGAFLSTSRSRISPSSAGGWCRCAIYMYTYKHTYIHAYMNICCVCDTHTHRPLWPSRARGPVFYRSPSAVWGRTYVAPSLPACVHGVGVGMRVHNAGHVQGG